MNVYLSEIYRKTPVKDLPLEMRNDIMVAVEESLNNQMKILGNMSSDTYQQAWDTAYNSKVCDLDKSVPVEFVDQQLTFYVVENLRYQQDGTDGFKINRYDNLQEAIKAFAELPTSYTSALGASLTGGPFGVGELDLVHRKNGDVVQVNDLKYSERWDNPLVRRAVSEINRKLGVEYESDLRLFGKTVLIPLQPWEKQKLNSYFVDKYLRPAERAEREAAQRYGDSAMYGPEHPVHFEYLHSAINEVFVPGAGWTNGKEFLAKLKAIDEYASPERLKVMNLNINYVDINGREGQADILPSQFGLLKKQTIERTAQHLPLDEQIAAADKIRQAQMGKSGKDLAQDKDLEPTAR